MKTRPELRELALTVRVPQDVLDQIDFQVKLRHSKIPRHSWLLEAIYEKLAREARMTNEGTLTIWDDSTGRPSEYRYRVFFMSYSPGKGGALQPKFIAGSEALEGYLCGLGFDLDDAKRRVEEVNRKRALDIHHVMISDEELTTTFGYGR